MTSVPAVKAARSSTIPPDLASLFFSPKTPWRVSPQLFERARTQAQDGSGGKAKLFVACELSQSDPECAAVMRYFLAHKPQNYGVKRILFVHNPTQTQAFESALQLMDAGAPNFPAAWQDEEPKAQRKATMKRWEEQTRQFSSVEILSSKRTDKITSCRVIPVWQGTRYAESICENGFTFFGKHHFMNALAKAGANKSTDKGYFGSGIYFTNSADYAAKYALMGDSNTLLLTFISMRPPFPVVNDVPIPRQGSDMRMLEGHGAYQNYTAHYIPVTSAFPEDPENMAYHPCYSNESPQYDEYVVFQPSHTLARFRVELGVDFPASPSAPSVPVATTIVNTLLTKLFELLEMPVIKQDREFCNILSKKAEALLSQYPNSPLSIQDQEYHRWVEQLFDTEGKLRPLVRQKLLQLPSASASHYDVKEGPKSSENPPAPKPSTAKPVSELESLKQRAEAGDAASQYSLGLRYYEGDDVERNYVTARIWFEKAAAQGDVDAQCNLGVQYASGQGVEKNFTIARTWFEQAAAKGDPDAQCNLGVLYHNGQGVEKNYIIARAWFEKAANQGDAHAQCNLGVLYHNGYGVERNYTTARFWYEKAAAQGDAAAREALATLAITRRSDYGSREKVDYKKSEVRNAPKPSVAAPGSTKPLSEQESVEQRAATGDVDAQYTLGMQFLKKCSERSYVAPSGWREKLMVDLFGSKGPDEVGKKQNYATARIWLEKAADQGHAQAQYELGNLYYYGNEGVEKNYIAAIEWYEKAAAQGHAKSAFTLGQYYHYKNVAAARSWYEKAAALGDVGAKKDLARLELQILEQSAEDGVADAQYRLGKLYELGEGVKRDTEMARIWYEQAADQGHAEAQNQMGILYYNGHGVPIQSFVEARGWYEKAAAQGNVYAQFNLGALYRDGEGVAQNDATACGWFEKAAAQGYVKAQNQMGECYYFGYGVERNLAIARSWYEKAAAQEDRVAINALLLFDASASHYGFKEKDDHKSSATLHAIKPSTAKLLSDPKSLELRAKAGDAEAQCALGLLYFKGEGVKENYIIARTWFEKAAAQENAEAQCQLGKIYEKGDLYGVEQNDTTAFHWYTKAAAQGNAEAQCQLGTLYDNGKGVERNSKTALWWWKKAAEQGVAEAQYTLGGLYEHGTIFGSKIFDTGVEKNLTTAHAWFEKAANQGHAAAQSRLGWLYLHGEGVEKNYITARIWFEKAAAQGDAEGQFGIGWLYRYGDGGLEQSDARNRLWWQKAADQGHTGARVRLHDAFLTQRAHLQEFSSDED